VSAWGSSERYFAIADAAERRALSEELVTEIAEALATAGEYVANIDPQPTQRVVDFNWAARQAGRRLGIRVEIDMKIARASVDGTAVVHVTAVEPPG
jgi:hypothetical protein